LTIGDSRIAASKLTATDTVANGIVEAMPALDFLEKVTIVDNDDNTRDEADVYEAVAEGLSFIVSDFQRFELAEKFSNRADVVALKVNHPMELEVPANVGHLILGGLVEINTNNARELAAYNAELADYHADIVARIKATG